MVGENKWVQLTDSLHDYVVRHSTPPDEIQRDLMAETAALGFPTRMMLAPEEAAFLSWLVRLLDVREAVEVGTFTGYSSLAIARALPPGGKLLCCDVSEEYTNVARRFWERAGVADYVELRIGPAAETLRALPAQERFDFALIDADKVGYPVYYEEILLRLKPGGLICADNVLWRGRVADETVDDDDTVALRGFNERVATDERVDAVLLTVADGLTLARKKG